VKKDNEIRCGHGDFQVLMGASGRNGCDNIGYLGLGLKRGVDAI
jgi:hypothetical protein